MPRYVIYVRDFCYGRLTIDAATKDDALRLALNSTKEIEWLTPQGIRFSQIRELKRKPTK